MLFKKILIANRGEIALRIIRTCREMGIPTVAIYSTADKNSLHVKLADEAICIGPPAGKLSYLNIPQIMAAVQITGADAVHPGYGFLAENASFAEICSEYGVKFIGPTADQIRMMGDKITAKETMIAAGVPVIPGSEGLLESIEEGKKLAGNMGYPVILKATAGGGGKGMRIVWADSEFEHAYHTARTEAGAAFGNDGLYLEKYIEEPRHIEIQVAGDQFGHIAHMSERDCSIQRRHQKLVEECPSPFLDDALRNELGEAARKAAGAINYEGLGTIEFLVDKHKHFYFMEMNTRIQVEHPVTEEAIDMDLVRLQIALASGKKLDQSAYFPLKYAMECRINAEDPHKGFMPTPGLISYLHTPKGYGVRVDTFIAAGHTVPPYYDSLIAKIICKGNNREEVIQRMKRALSEFLIDGIKTTIPFHKALMDDPDFRSGNFNTKFLESFDFSKMPVD